MQLTRLDMILVINALQAINHSHPDFKRRFVETRRILIEEFEASLLESEKLGQQFSHFSFSLKEKTLEEYNHGQQSQKA